MSVRSRISITTCPNFTKFSTRDTCGRGSVLRRQYYTLCTSGFVDDVILTHNGVNGAESMTTRMFRTVRQVATLEAKSAISDCLLLLLCFPCFTFRTDDLYVDEGRRQLPDVSIDVSFLDAFVLGASVLEPDLDLRVGESERLRQFTAARPCHVLDTLVFHLELQSLLGTERRPLATSN